LLINELIRGGSATSLRISYVFQEKKKKKSIVPKTKNKQFLIGIVGSEVLLSGPAASARKFGEMKLVCTCFSATGQNFSSFLRPAVQILRPRPATAVWPELGRFVSFGIFALADVLKLEAYIFMTRHELNYNLDRVHVSIFSASN
jgi:hypothetical protein